LGGSIDVTCSEKGRLEIARKVVSEGPIDWFRRASTKSGQVYVAERDYGHAKIDQF
jgi:hypothetical protein